LQIGHTFFPLPSLTLFFLGGLNNGAFLGLPELSGVFPEGLVGALAWPFLFNFIPIII
jgi:hypothetical protein